MVLPSVRYEMEVMYYIIMDANHTRSYTYISLYHGTVNKTLCIAKTLSSTFSIYNVGVERCV